jgi:cytochrome c-type biogenesis protein CcmF
MEYLGEHLLPGQIGQFFAIVSLVASLVATIAFFTANQKNSIAEKQSWIKLARFAFLLETVSVFIIFGTLYYIISNHLFEYKYAWQHSDKSLQVEYLLSCFWEGQEGSFMLWSFWHCVLGWILIYKAKDWEAGTMTVVSFAQFCLASMLVGLYFFSAKLGSSPFMLLRNDGILDSAPIMQDTISGGIRADYLSLLKDGRGLNTLLQNYWMVIHPPVLFLGFASTIVPFAFAFAGLMKKDHSWTKPALPWASFSAGILGLGIMMGAAWAYESLSFGGYWAWDPVENASLVPWLVMISGLHANLIYKSTTYSLRSAYFFYITAFLLILYSTFLTRSGILGDTSVHAFTDLGMNTQLLLFLLIFVVPSYTLYIFRYKSIPTIVKEESTYSREFWMFIGSLVFFLSGILIIAKTSVPVYNKIFNASIAPSEDPEFAYNQIQVFVAIIIGLLTAITQYLKYKDTPKGYLTKKIWLPTFIALVISIAISVFGNISYDKKGIGFLGAIHVAIFAAVYATVANASYIVIGLKGKLKFAAASVAHFGFGLVLVGILISSSKKSVLSWNTTGVATFKKDKREDPAENITLFKALPTDMGKYMVTYAKDTFNTKERKRFFEVTFKAKNSNEQFSLYPDLIKNNKDMEGFAANPASKHYWYKDIFVYISSFQENTKTDTTSFVTKEIGIGDTVYYSNGFLVLHKVDKNPPALQGKFGANEQAVFLDLEVLSKEGKRYKASPGIALKGIDLRSLPDTVISQSMVIQFNKVPADSKGKFEIGIKESSGITDLITLKVYEFPMINLLWMGIIITVIGFGMAVVQRVRPTGNKVVTMV